jgi:hypothetical protein
VNLLAEVKPNEEVFLVGAFNNWNPQDPLYAMKPVVGQAGKFTISLTFPGDYYGGLIDTGASFEYKFAKTTDLPGDPPAGDPWGNGVKDFFKIDVTHPCTKFPAETSGLFELKPNLTITIPASDMEVPYTVPAWRDLAEMLGPYKSCD